MKCNAVLSIKGGSTKGLLTHLKTKHCIQDPSKKRSGESHEEPGTSQSSSSLSSESAPDLKRSKISSYFNAPREDSGTIIARMVAKDGLPFRVFITSSDLRAALHARGVQVPKSAKTVQQRVMDFADAIQEQIKNELHERRQSGERFSLTMDEWTGGNNRRYANVNVHMSDRTMHNLGLLRIKGSFTSELCVDFIENWIATFGLALRTDIVSCTTDGASVMVKFGKLIDSEHQLCYAHGVHLAVTDILYRKCHEITHVDATSEEDEEDDSDDEELLDGGLQCEFENSRPRELLVDSVKDLINRVRCIVRIFRKSPRKNDVLQKLIKEQHGRELNLILDTPTRWNSLMSMLERFLCVITPVRSAMLQMDLDPPTRDEIDELKKMCVALKPLELAVKTLSQHDCTLVVAERCLEFTVQELSQQDYELSKTLAEALKRRISERRGATAIAMKFLAGDGVSACNAFEINAVKYTLISIAHKLGLTPPSEETGLAHDKQEIRATVEDRLHMALLGKQQEGAAVPLTLESAIGRELEFFRVCGQRGKLLSRLYEALQSIPPTSVDAERAFSSGGAFLTKVRSRLCDSTLSKLVMLRHYLSKFH